MTGTDKPVPSRSVRNTSGNLHPNQSSAPASSYLFPQSSHLPQASRQSISARSGGGGGGTSTSAASSSADTTMIGPTTTFYDPDQVIPPQSQEYHHWTGDSYDSQQQQMPFARALHHAGYQFPQQPQENVPRSSDPLQTASNQYQFITGQYNQPMAVTHHYPQEDQQEYSASSQPGATYDQQPSQLSNPDVFSFFTEPINSHLLSADPAFASKTPSHQFQSHSPGAYTPSPDFSLKQLTGNTPSALPASWTENSGGRPAQVQAAKRGRSSAKVNAPAGRSRKRPRKIDVQADSGESESEDEGSEAPPPRNNLPRGATMLARLPGACTHCKKLKMKCDFPSSENTCKRCKTGGHVCVVEGRKPRTAPNKREYLLAQIRQKDAIIESLLKQLHNPYLATPMSISSYQMATSPSDQNNKDLLMWLDRLHNSGTTAGDQEVAKSYKLELRRAAEDDGDESEEDPAGADEDPGTGGDDDDDDDVVQNQNLPDAAVPLGLIANLSLSNNKRKAKNAAADARREEIEDDDVGVASSTYFLPGPATDLEIRATMIERHSPPEILVHGLVKPEDVDKLFELFYTWVNPFLSLLDPVLHTPTSTFQRCPFLFTVICAISSRYYKEKSEIYPIAMHFAKHAAANALIDGWKSVELCQAYILMSVYAVPARRWEEDRSWLYTGLAIRIATDLNLHQAPVSTKKALGQKQEREILNKTRVWMICFNLDRSTATQFGKPTTIKSDFVVRTGKDWYKKSKYNHKFDIHLCAYSCLLRIVAGFHDEIFSDPSSPSGLNKSVDFRQVTATHDENLTRFHEEWAARFQEDPNAEDPAVAFRCSLLPFLVGYSRLVMYSFGFQHAFQRGLEPGDRVCFIKCFDAATSVITNMVDNLAPSGYMRYAPDGHFVFAAFASAFLLKLLRPEFANLMTKEQEQEVFDLIGRLIQTLSSPDIAIDDRHTPKLYARFLAELLMRHRHDGASGMRLHAQPPPQNSLPSGSSGAATAATHGQSAPFSMTQVQGGAPEGSQQGQGQVQGYGQPMYKPKPEPIYRHEASSVLGTGTIEFSSNSDAEQFYFGLEALSTNPLDEETLATMQALKNPSFWQNMMMPGFIWPDASSPVATTSMDAFQQQNIPAMHHGLATYPPEVTLY